MPRGRKIHLNITLCFCRWWESNPGHPSNKRVHCPLPLSIILDLSFVADAHVGIVVADGAVLGVMILFFVSVIILFVLPMLILLLLILLMMFAL